LSVRGAYLHFEEWHVRWREYRIRNKTGQAVEVLVEHPRTSHYDLFDTPPPAERTDEHLRFGVEVSQRDEASLRVQERRLTRRREELRRQSYKGLRRYLQRGLIQRDVHDQVANLLRLWERIADNEESLAQVGEEREEVYKAQEQIQGNMGALSHSGKEGAMRTRYVERLEATEEQLRDLAQRESALKADIERLKEEVEARVVGLSGPETDR
jgi:hypothetical protein